MRAGGQGRSQLGPPSANSQVASLPTHDAAAGLEPGDQLGVDGRHVVLAQLRMAGRRNPRGFDDVLQRIGDAVHRPARRAGHQLALGFGRLGQCRLLGHPQKAVQLAVMRGDAREERLGHLDRRQLALAIEPAQLGDRQEGDIHRGVLEVALHHSTPTAPVDATLATVLRRV